MGFFQFNYFKFFWQHDEQNTSILMVLGFQIFLCKKSYSKFILGLKGDLTLISNGVFSSTAGSCPNETFLTWQITQEIANDFLH